MGVQATPNSAGTPVKNEKLDYLNMRVRMAQKELSQAKRDCNDITGTDNKVLEAQRNLDYYNRRIKEEQGIFKPKPDCGAPNCKIPGNHRHIDPKKGASPLSAGKKARSARGKKGVEPLPDSYKKMKIEGETVEYEVQKGDNIWKLAKGILSEGGKKPTNAEIMKLTMQISGTNQSRFRNGNPNLIYPGQKLLLPKSVAIDNKALEKKPQGTKKSQDVKQPVIVPEAKPAEETKPKGLTLPKPSIFPEKKESKPMFPNLPPLKMPGKSSDEPKKPSVAPETKPADPTKQPDIVPGGKGAPYGDSTAEKKSDVVAVSANLHTGIDFSKINTNEARIWYQNFWGYLINLGNQNHSDVQEV